jgi:hypothetical protein
MKQLNLVLSKRFQNNHPFFSLKTRLSRQLVPALSLLAALAGAVAVSAQTVITFDAPGAGTGAGQGTYPFNISPSGTTVGFVRDADDVRHGFLRTANGDFTVFDARARVPREARERALTPPILAARSRDFSSTRSAARMAMSVTPTAQSPSSMSRARLPRSPFSVRS